MYKECYDNRTYYKRGHTTTTSSWTQPTLTANGSAVNNFFVNSYYNVFYPNTKKFNEYKDEKKLYFDIRMSSYVQLIPTKFTFVVWDNSDDWSYGTAINCVFAGSNDGSTWTTLGTIATASYSTSGTTNTFNCSSNTTSYRYLKFTGETKGTAYNDRLVMSSFRLYAKEQTTTYYTTVSTSSDYDYYINKFKVPKIDNKYYVYQGE